MSIDSTLAESSRKEHCDNPHIFVRRRSTKIVLDPDDSIWE